MRQTIPVALPGAEGETIALAKLELAAQRVLREAGTACDRDRGDARCRRARAPARRARANRQLVPELVGPALVVEHEQPPGEAERPEVAGDPGEAFFGEILR